MSKNEISECQTARRVQHEQLGRRESWRRGAALVSLESDKFHVQAMTAAKQHGCVGMQLSR